MRPPTCDSTPAQPARTATTTDQRSGRQMYGLWNTLLSRNPSGVVAPFAMLVPVFGVLSSWLFFDEVPDLVELVAGALVVGGVVYGSRTGRRRGTGDTPVVETGADDADRAGLARR